MERKRGMKVRSSTFFLDDTVPVVLYGGGVRGIQFFHTLRARGVPILAFFDINAAEGTYLLDCPVYTPTAIPEERIGQLRSALVLIALQNAGIHEDVVKLLVRQGFAKILYLPLAGDSFHDNAEALLLRQTYLAYTEEHGIDEMHAVLPLTELHSVEYTEQVILKKSNSFVIAEIPLQLLATDGRNHAAESFAYSPVTQLFSFFSGRKGDLGAIEESFYAHEEEFGYLLKKTFYEYVSDRQLLYGRFSAALGEGMQFFQTSPSYGVWRDGYFAIEDGNHRTAFLYDNNLFFPPARMTRNDYRKWRNHIVADRIIQELADEEVLRIFLWHPYTNKRFVPFMQEDCVLIRFLLMLERKRCDKESGCLLYRLPKSRGIAAFFGFPPVFYPMLALSMEGYDVIASFEKRRDICVAEMFFSLYYQDITTVQKKESPHMPELLIATWDYFQMHGQENAAFLCHVLVLTDIPQGQQPPIWLRERKELLHTDEIKANEHYDIKAWEMN